MNKKLTYESKIGELYASPIGHDTIAKVLMQLGISEKAITNPIVSNLKLKTIHNLTKKQSANIVGAHRVRPIANFDLSGSLK